MYAETAMPEGAYLAGTGQNAVSSNSLLNAILTDLGEATALAGDINSNLHDTRMRLFGPWPEKGSEGCASNQIKPPPSLEMQMTEAVARLRSQLLSAREHCSVVANRL